MAHKSDEDRRRYAREWHAKRMAEDLQYAEEYRAKKAAYKAKRRADPEARARFNAASNKWNNGPEGKAWRVERDKIRSESGYFKEYYEKRRQDPEFRAKEAAAARAWRAANPEKQKENAKRAFEKLDKKVVRMRRLQWKYRMSAEEYEARLVTQQGKCHICFGDNAGKSLVVDHDHALPIGEGNRWLLCVNCNSMLGMAKDSPEILERAAELLRGRRGA